MKQKRYWIILCRLSAAEVLPQVASRCCSLQIAFPQTVELQYVEVSGTDGGKSLQPGNFQVYGRMGECDSAYTFVELTDGPKWLEDGPVLLDAKALQTERLAIRGDFQEVIVRAIGALCFLLPSTYRVGHLNRLHDLCRRQLPAITATWSYKHTQHVCSGTVLADASASSAAASATLQLSEVPQHLPKSSAQEQPVPSHSLLPLRGLPQYFVQALEPLARYWQAVGMSLGTTWPDCMVHYLADETFSPLVTLAEDLMTILIESSPTCHLSVPMLQRLKAHMQHEAGESTCHPIPSQVPLRTIPFRCICV